MRNKFNAWTDFWIPVETLSGDIEKVGIYQALKNAQDYLGIRASTPSESFGITRLLITVLMDIYRPLRWACLDDIRNSKKFKQELIEKYYSTCLHEGSTFELFDEKKPFLQYAFSDEKFGVKTAAVLFDHLATGNTVPLFSHKAEDTYSFKPARCLQALCSIPFYEKHKRGKKVTTGINGVPPIYFLYSGDSLFETLAVSMVPKSQYSESEFGLPIWRDKNCFKKEKVVVPELLHGLFSAPLKIQLIQNDDGKVERLKIVDDGIDYTDVEWKDPHVAYYKNKKNEVKSLKARNARAVWRDLPVVVNPGSLSFLFDWRNRGISKQIIAYVKLTELKATVFMSVSQFVEDLKIPVEIISNELKRESYSSAISLSDTIANECSGLLRRQIDSAEANSYADILSSTFTIAFLAAIKETFDDSLIGLLLKLDTDMPDWEEKVEVFLNNRMKNAFQLALNDSLDLIGDENVNTLFLKSSLKNKVSARFYRLLKKGG